MPDPIPRAAAPGRLQAALPVLLAAGLVAPFCFRVVDETDLGFHLALGRHVLESGIPRANLLSWTAAQEPWYATSWLYDAAMAAAVRAFGLAGAQGLTWLLAVATLAGAARAGARLEPRLGAWVAPLLALLLAPRITPRPHVATWALLAWTLALCLEPDDAQGRPRLPGVARRAACVGLVALGSNLHAGAVFVAAALGAFCLEAFLATRRPRDLAVAGAGLLALLANPGGLFNVRYALAHLSVQDVVPLAEFEPPRLVPALLFHLLVPVALALAFAERRRRPALLLLAVAFAALGLRHVRLVYKFEIVAMAAVAAGLALAVRRFGARRAAVAGALVLCAVAAVRAPLYARVDVGARWDEQRLPVRAARFIREEGLSGPLFNSFLDGGYLAWELPGLRVFQDARVQAWPAEFFGREQAVEGDPAALRAWWRELGVEWALVARRDSRLAGWRGCDAPDWALVWWDDARELCVRRDVARWAGLVERLEYRHFLPRRNPLPAIARAGPGELAAIRAELERFSKAAPDHPHAALAGCAARLRSGERDPAVCATVRALAATASALAGLAREALAVTPP